MLRRVSVFSWCLVFLLVLGGCTVDPAQKVRHVTEWENQAMEGTAPEDYAGVRMEKGEPIILYVTEGSTRSLRYWQSLIEPYEGLTSEECSPTEIRYAKYSANDAYAWWYEIQNIPYGEAYIDYAFRLTGGLELDETLGYRVYLEATGEDAADVQALIEEKYGDFIQPLTDELRDELYYKQSSSIAGPYLYELDSDKVRLNQIEQELKESPLDFKYETQAEWVEQALPGGYPGYWDVRLHLDYWDAGAFEIKNQIEPEWADGTVRVYADIDDDFAFETDTPGYSAGYTGSK